MKDYHFENDNHDFDETIKLDDINKELKKYEEERTMDELGDKDEFLNAFESEKFDRTLNPGSPNPRLEREMPREENNEAPRPPRRKKPQSFWTKNTVGIVVGIAVLVGILFFALARGLFSSGDEPDGPVVTEGASAVLVNSILDSGEMVIYDIEGSTTKSISLSDEVEIIGERSEILQQSDILQGELLMLTLDKAQKIATKVDFGNGIVRKEVTGLSADTANHVLMSEKESYGYATKAVFMFDGNQLKAGDLEPCDKLILKGIGETVWSVEVLEYHGFIVVENKENIKEGKFKLDDEEEVPLKDVEKIAVSEGAHTITVSGENIETRTISAFVEVGEEYVCDLSKAQEKVGVLIIDSNVSDYKLYINGALVDSTTPTVLPLGEYDVVILKSGYNQFTQKVTLDKDTLTVSATLVKEVQYGTLKVTADVGHATVYINDEERGTTPLEVNLPYGIYDLRVSESGYDTYTNTVTINSSSTSVYAVLD